LHREAGQKLLLERRIAALQAQMLDMRVRAARGDMPLQQPLPLPLDGRADWGGVGAPPLEWGGSAAGGAGGGGGKKTPRRNGAALQAGGSMLGV
jgi:hypothetical protein